MDDGEDTVEISRWRSAFIYVRFRCLHSFFGGGGLYWFVLERNLWKKLNKTGLYHRYIIQYIPRTSVQQVGF
jgi:hypothetical protein